jgi:hypothetical protein
MQQEALLLLLLPKTPVEGFPLISKATTEGLQEHQLLDEDLVITYF